MNTIEEKLDNFMKERQKQIGHPFNIFEYLQAVSDFFQTIDKNEANITEEQFNMNKKFSKLCFELSIDILKEFKITEKDGILLDYFKND